MPNRFGKIFGAVFLLSGAWHAAALTFDAPVILEMPARVDKGENISIGIVNLITDLILPGAAGGDVERDSLHVGFALPEGWDVISVSAHPAFDFRPARASVNHLDTNYRNQLLVDSLEAYSGGADTLAPDPGLGAYVKGRSYRIAASPDSLGRSFTIKADSVRWVGFKRSLGLSIPAGEAPDTVMGGTAIKQIPVFIHAVLKAGSRDETVSPVLIVKSGPLDTVGQSNRTDPPALVYRPLTVGSPVSILFRSRLPMRIQVSSMRDLLGRRMGGESSRALYLNTLP